jgi:hypothetical protein
LNFSKFLWVFKWFEHKLIEEIFAFHFVL